MGWGGAAGAQHDPGWFADSACWRSGRGSETVGSDMFNLLQVCKCKILLENTIQAPYVAPVSSLPSMPLVHTFNCFFGFSFREQQDISSHPVLKGTWNGSDPWC